MASTLNLLIITSILVISKTHLRANFKIHRTTINNPQDILKSNLKKKKGKLKLQRTSRFNLKIR